MARAVTQEDEMGCSIACVAFAIKEDYQKTKRLFTHAEHATSRGYYCKEIIHALKKRALNYSFRKVNEKNTDLINKQGSIVFIKRDKNYPEGHFLLKTEKEWMDPWMNIPVYPRKGGFRKELPGEPEWVIYPK